MTVEPGSVPDISIVTISFNQAPYLRRAIDSILSQSGVDVEHIVVDPGSTDDSRAIVDSYGDRIAHRVYEPDAGPADGLNRGLARASSPLFAYLNADDEYLPGALARMVAAIRRRPDCDVVYANGFAADAKGNRTGHLVASTRFDAKRYAAGRGVIVQQSSIMRTDALRRVGGFVTANRTSWDGEAFCDMALAGSRFGRVEDDWALFRIYADSITGSQRLADAYAADHERIFAKVHGRPMTPKDHRMAAILRKVDLLRNPVHTARRLLGRSR